MMHAGYTIFPVNPQLKEYLGQRSFSNLSDIRQPIDIVNIFRRPEYVIPIVEEAIKINAKIIWMQLGVINPEAAQIAVQAGLQIVMDRCIKIEHNLIFNW